MQKVRSVVVAVVALSLLSCDKPHAGSREATESEDCLDLPIYPPPTITDRKQTAFACVEQHAAMYAKGPDTPQAISDAVVVKCQDEIMAYVAEAAKKAGEEPHYTEAIESWRKHALPVIAEARARKCYS